MGDRKRKPALGGGLDSLFGPDDLSEGHGSRDQENPGPSQAAEGGAGKPGARAIVLVLVAFVLGAALEFVLSEIKTRIAPGLPAATADERMPLSPAPPVPFGQIAPSSGSGGPPNPGAGNLPDTSDFSPPPPPEAFHDAALREKIHRHFPLTPGDIRLMKKAVEETQKAVHGPVPEGRAVSVRVSLDPGAVFPEIHLVPGIATTITVVDATGAPWPIEDLIVGNEKSFPVRRLSTPNGVVIEPKNNVGWTSLSLILAGRGTPAVLKLVDSDRLSDTRVTARIEGRGPNAVAPLFREPKPVVTSRILAYLDGIPPAQARSLIVRGTKDMEAWREGTRLFVRTHLDVLAPAWLETVSGPNGMKLYVFPPVSVITAAGEDGEMLTVELGEGDDDAGKG